MAGFNDKIINEFRANGGRVGGFFEGATMVLLHTVGARSGQLHLVPTIGFPEGEDIAVVASAGGAPNNPAWYHNVLAHPEITVEVGVDDRIEDRRLTARQTQGPERDRLWQRIIGERSGFAEYEAKTDRVIPVVLLSPV